MPRIEISGRLIKGGFPEKATFIRFCLHLLCFFCLAEGSFCSFSKASVTQTTEAVKLGELKRPFCMRFGKTPVASPPTISTLEGSFTTRPEVDCPLVGVLRSYSVAAKHAWQSSSAVLTVKPTSSISHSLLPLPRRMRVILQPLCL